MSTSSGELERLTGAHWSVQAHLERRSGLWYPTASKPVSVSYPDDCREALASVEASSFWFRHRNHAIGQLARRARVDGAIWDVGAGNGSVAAHLQQRGFEVVAVEPSQTGAASAHALGVKTVIVGRLEDLQLPTGSLRAATAFDVLEHLPDPAGVITEIARVLGPDGLLLVSVPAYRWLWSDADVDAGHYRRYTRRSLHDEIVGHGFDRREARYAFHSLVPAVLLGRVVWPRVAPGLRRGDRATRLTKQLHPRRRLARAIAGGAFALERAMDSLAPLPFGTSILATYRRRPPQ